jgi:multicomponent Na+:H+ antiporter subunit B
MKGKASAILLWCCTVLLLLALGALCLEPILARQPGSLKRFGTAGTKDHFYRRGVEESGALNLVSAIYLGYRAFDTLGETIVLVLSVAGVTLITGARE